MADDGSISLGDDNPFDSWDSTDDVQSFCDAPTTKLDHSFVALHTAQESVQDAMENTCFTDLDSRSFLHFGPEQQRRSYSSDEISLNIRDAIFSEAPSEAKKKLSLLLEEESPSLLQFQAEHSESKSNYHEDLIGKSKGSLQDFRLSSSGKTSYSLKYENDHKRTITFQHSIAAGLEEDPLDSSLRTVDIFSMGQSYGSSLNSRSVTVPDGSDDDDFSFVVEEDVGDDLLEKEIKRQLMYNIAGMGLFYVLGKLFSCLCKLCQKGHSADMEAVHGGTTATSATGDSMMGMQLGVATTMGSGGTTAPVNPAVVASMAIRAAANTAASAASASDGMAAVVSADGAVAAAGVSGLTIGTMATVVIVAVSATVVSSGIPALQEQVGCTGSEIQESLGRMRIKFRNLDLPPKNALEDLFVSAYNSGSQGCSEEFRRTVVSASLESYAESDFGVDTLWTASVSCSPECPAEPLFGRTSLPGAYGRQKLADGKDFVSLSAFGEYLDDYYLHSSFFVDQQCGSDTADDSCENTRNDTYVVYVQVLNASYGENGTGEPSLEILDEYYVNGDNVPSASPSEEPTISNAPTLTATPTQQPTTAYPTIAPTTASPSSSPSSSPTVEPSKEPTGEPTISSAPSPTTATTAPTALPSESPSTSPSLAASGSPSSSPSSSPLIGIRSQSPTAVPSVVPSIQAFSPTIDVSTSPSVAASNNPTIVVSNGPTVALSNSPTIASPNSPTIVSPNSPTIAATNSPTIVASNNPTVLTSSSPTIAAFNTPTVPTAAASNNPTILTTSSPTIAASNNPTIAPSKSPTIAPSNSPTIGASDNPTIAASSNPTLGPSNNPTIAASSIPTTDVSDNPTLPPSNSPSIATSSSPSIGPSIVVSNSPSVDVSSAPTSAEPPSVACCSSRPNETSCNNSNNCGGCVWDDMQTPSCVPAP
eukprot:scaffold2224_cov167-Cylindrotheca_fusiformis.AAC.3